MAYPIFAFPCSGSFIWQMMEGEYLFQNIRSSEGEYDARAHLGQMIALLGPPPQMLLDREKSWNKTGWKDPYPNSVGKPCFSAREFFGGPFFDSEGEFMYKHLIPTNVSLESSVTSLQGDDKQLFLMFAQKMLQWLPEHRATARELLEDPWLYRVKYPALNISPNNLEPDVPLHDSHVQKEGATAVLPRIPEGHHIIE
ncbi:hypothetical protein B7494_g8499, partial [Chlorociboria aeruginascens]